MVVVLEADSIPADTVLAAAIVLEAGSTLVVDNAAVMVLEVAAVIVLEANNTLAAAATTMNSVSKKKPKASWNKTESWVEFQNRF